MSTDFSNALDLALAASAAQSPAMLTALRRAIDKAVAGRQTVDELRQALARQGVSPSFRQESPAGMACLG